MIAAFSWTVIFGASAFITTAPWVSLIRSLSAVPEQSERQMAK